MWKTKRVSTKKRVELVEKAKIIYKQELEKHTEECRIGCIAFTGIYTGRVCKHPSVKRFVLDWNSPAGEKAAMIATEFLNQNGLMCFMKMGTYD